jgi:two-component system, sensor histidine kinase RegB
MRGKYTAGRRISSCKWLIPGENPLWRDKRPRPERLPDRLELPLVIMATFSDTSASLRRLFILRSVAIAGQALAIALAVILFDLSLPVTAMGAVIGLLIALNLRTWTRLRKPGAVGDGELFAELLADVAALTALLYLSGGSTNPFVSLYLLPLSIAAIALPPRYAWAMAALTMACYSGLMFYYRPLGNMHDLHGNSFNLHLLGMWVNFLVSAVLIAAFVAGMSLSIRARDRQLAAARERTLRDEQVLALGTFAAGAAHELGTPLSTIAVLTRELEHDHAAVPQLAEDLILLRAQVDNCKRIIAELTAAAGQARAGDAAPLGIEAFLQGVVDRWTLIRPEARARVLLAGPGPAPRIVGEDTVRQTLINILNNAADASPQDVEVEGSWDSKELTIEVRDRGAGVSQAAAERAGRSLFSTKAEGRGIGLLLANATIERLGGSVTLVNREGGGGCTRVRLPLASLSATP